MESKKYTSTAYIRNLDIKFIGERFVPSESILDTTVEIDGKPVCAITWNDKENFLKELSDVFEKYSI